MQTATIHDSFSQSNLANAQTEGAVPDIPFLPPSPQTPDQWFDWYDQVLNHRLNILVETADPGPAGEAARAREVDRCRRSRPYMIATYGSIYEARPAEESYDENEPPAGFMIPFVPFPYQIRVMFEYYRIRKTRGVKGDGLWVKSRDMGLSNLAGFLIAGDWACEPVFQARMLSRVEDLVDATGDPDSLFWKIEQFLAGLPKWLFAALVPGFDWKRHRQKMRFINPATKNTIAGESTQANAGRGGRATVIIYDEAAFMPNFGAIWTAGRASTRHRIAISTVSVDEGLDFYNLHHGKGGYDQPSILRIPHYEHPFHDDDWLAQERARDTEEGIQREVFMNYQAGTGEWVYPESHVKNPGDYPFIPGAGHAYVTMDDGFDDDFAIVWVQYIRETGRFRVFQGYKNSHLVTDFYGSLLKGVPESGPGINFPYGMRERKIMQRQLELPPMTYTVDAHMTNVEQLTGSSPFERLASKYGIVPHMSFKKRSFKDRRLALGAILPLMDFHDGDGGEEVLEALQRYRFKSVREGRDQLSEYKQPLHDKDSHYVTALEWFAVSWPDIKYAAGQESFRYHGKPANS